MYGWQLGLRVGQILEKAGKWGLAARTYRGMVTTTEKSNPNVNYRLGFAYFRLNNNAMAAEYLERSITLLDTRPAWHYRLGFINERNKNYDSAIINYQNAIELDGDIAEWHYRLGRAQILSKNKSAAIETLKKAVAIEPDNRRYVDTLFSTIRSNSAHWAQLAYLIEMEKIYADNAYWNYLIGRSYETMHQIEKAPYYYRRANSLDTNNKWWHFYEGRALYSLGREAESKQSYDKAIAADQDLEANLYGIGVFHQKIGDWTQSTQAYKLFLDDNGVSEGLLYRLGLSVEKTYKWAEAIVYYRQALEYKDSNPKIRYRLGYVMERSVQLEQAQLHYKAAASELPLIHEKMYYRLAYVQEQLGNFEISASNYLRHNNEKFVTIESTISRLLGTKQANLSSLALAIRTYRETHTHAEALIDESWLGRTSLGLQSAAKGQWSDASSLLQSGIDRSDNYYAELYYWAGQCLAHSRHFENACRILRQTEVYQSAASAEHPIAARNARARAIANYVEYRETLPIRRDFVLYESHMGSSIDCNPLAIFRGLLGDPKYQQLTHIWVISPDKFDPDIHRNHGNVLFVIKDTDLYRRYLATAEFLVNNVTFQNYYVRRAEQKYLNTWHGTPLKTLGKDIKSGYLEHANVARNFLQATHILTPNHHTTQKLIEQYDVDGILTAKIGFTGYPRTDLTINASDNTKLEILGKLGLAEKTELPIVLYAPTWRGNTTEQHFETERLISDLRALNSLDINLIFRAHPHMEKVLERSDLHNITVDNSINTNSLLSVVDVLVTDYSSVLFDFLPTGRPICLYAYDLESYQDERGLYFDMKQLPASLSTDIGGLMVSVQAAVQGPNTPDAAYTTAQATYTAADDGSATERVIDFFFNENTDHQIVYKSSSKKSLLFRASLIPNGVTASFLNLLSQLDPDIYDITLVLEASVFRNDPDRLGKALELPPHVKVVGRLGTKTLRPEEHWLESKLLTFGDLESPEQWSIYRAAYEREFQRVFGDSRFDAVIEFDGYSQFWSSFLVHGRKAAGASLIYQHSDMLSEWKSRAHYLTAVFSLYRAFDKLVSVSNVMQELNRDQLAANFDISPNAFEYCQNQINVDELLDKSERELDSDIRDWLDDKAYFCTVGRLSPEKNHKKLLLGFRLVCDSSPSARLVIVGDGPLSAELGTLIQELGLVDNVLLAGSRSNPFPILRNSVCFVLSSDHEGQPMVLLESMVLDKPIVSVDISGARSVLQNGYGMLVRNDPEGLAVGMLEFRSFDVERKSFDAWAYQDQTSRKFSSLLD